MFRTATLSVIAAAAFLLTAAATSSAQNPSPATWSYSGGYFQELGGGVWLERNSGGVDYYFRETFRTLDYVEMFDSSRNIGIRLYPSCCLISIGGQSYRFLYSGGWAARR